MNKDKRPSSDQAAMPQHCRCQARAQHCHAANGEHTVLECTRLVPPSRTPPTASPARARARARSAVRTSVRNDIWTVLRYRRSIPHDSGLQFASYMLEICILTLVLLNVVVAIVGSASHPSPSTGVAPPSSDWNETFLFVSTIIFSIEYALRFWSCVEDERYSSPGVGRLKWMLQPMSVIDLLALIPFYIEIGLKYLVIPSYQAALTLRSLRLLRIISFLRLERSYSAMTNMRVIFSKKKEELLVVSYLTGVLVLTSSTMIFFLENSAQPAVFSSVGACAWWSVETITSLGYGDIVPQTTAGRLFGALLALWGIILFTIPGAILGSAFIEVMLEKQRQDDEDAFSVMLAATTEPTAGAALRWSNIGASDHDGDSTPTFSPVGLSASQSFRRLSPRVSSALRFELLNQKVDEITANQRQLQLQLSHQQEQLAELRLMLQQLLARQ
ncbi:hypothetical protein P43SY_006491 [Pythium insidiosum]|uniref:Ion transport domain-containing protein n=1 Tax=Pythium insidiosum TaxID=114742 RepID=A0AAD5LFS9_PYTIN|nr:hypothetical protein P43SY_006491 [Pythium insidiosum]